MLNLGVSGFLGAPDANPLPGDIWPPTFATKTWLMIPFIRRGFHHDKQVFNYRLSRARRVVENTFSVLANRFYSLLSNLLVHVDTEALVMNEIVCLPESAKTPGGRSSTLCRKNKFVTAMLSPQWIPAALSLSQFKSMVRFHCAPLYDVEVIFNAPMCMDAFQLPDVRIFPLLENTINHFPPLMWWPRFGIPLINVHHQVF